jgi:hypothetical protein
MINIAQSAQVVGRRDTAAMLLLLCIAVAWGATSCSSGPSCPDRLFVFRHEPSDYYGAGQFFATCPSDGEAIRCYHYHRHWICEKADTLFWDRNLESAARSACGCPPLPETLPASPAVSENPEQRVF